MGRRQRRRAQQTAPQTSTQTTEYRDADGNVLSLREAVSAGTVERFHALESRPGASFEDLEERRLEFLFERLAVSWEIAGVPLEGQGELLGRLRMADPELRRWVRATVTEHARARQPELRV